MLGIHPLAIQKLIRQGRLPAEKVANRWLIPRAILEEFAKTYEGKRGRPRQKRKYTKRSPKWNVK
jgi:excisionase family DNA binding protein